MSFRLKKSVPKARPQSTDNVRESKEILHEIEKKLRFREESPHFAHQQVLYTLLIRRSADYLADFPPINSIGSSGEMENDFKDKTN